MEQFGNEHMESSRPSGTVTFLFTDIEGSTSIAEEYPRDWERMKERHDVVLKKAIQANGGHLFQIVGDQFCAAFHTAGEAVSASLEIERTLRLEKWDPVPIYVRIGLHTGAAHSAALDPLSGGYRGYLSLALVQRVTSTAHGGQILMSSATVEIARNEVPNEVELLDMHEHRLEGLVNPQHLWQVAAPGLESDLPPLKSLNDIPNNLPAQLTEFIGRERQVEEIQIALGERRPVTLTGAGGSGKTRLSLQDPQLVPHAVTSVSESRPVAPFANFSTTSRIGTCSSYSTTESIS